MPPIKSEKTLLNSYLKEKKKMNMHQLDKYVHNRLFIDVNDPSFDYIMKDMRDKNEYLKKLLEEEINFENLKVVEEY